MSCKSSSMCDLFLHSFTRLSEEGVIPEICEEFLPGQRQDIIDTTADRVLADQDEILKYAFFFQKTQSPEIVPADLFGGLDFDGCPFADQKINLMAVF